jgi:hypothetical protein
MADTTYGKKWEELEYWFRDLVYDALVDTMVIANNSHDDHYDKDQVDWIQDCEFDEFMERYGNYDGDVLYTDNAEYVINGDTENLIIDAFCRARDIEIENFYDDNKEYIW